MSVGILIVTHGKIGEEMLHAAECILKERLSIGVLSVLESDQHQLYQEELKLVIDRYKTSEGLLILCDLFGSTPCNLCIPFLKKDEVEMITGVNMPMILKLASQHYKSSLQDLIASILEYGQKHIIPATERLISS
ncbi:MAG: PTS sugar transporter subunit IIA [Deltaproteobacteria bacterium]|nr:PTS sugar transporter subunit IIA [Deltaproteobacteria bacterium]